MKAKYTCLFLLALLVPCYTNEHTAKVTFSGSGQADLTLSGNIKANITAGKLTSLRSGVVDAGLNGEVHGGGYLRSKDEHGERVSFVAAGTSGSVRTGAGGKPENEAQDELAKLNQFAKVAQDEYVEGNDKANFDKLYKKYGGHK